MKIPDLALASQKVLSPGSYLPCSSQPYQNRVWYITGFAKFLNLPAGRFSISIMPEESHLQPIASPQSFSEVGNTLLTVHRHQESVLCWFQWCDQHKISQNPVQQWQHQRQYPGHRHWIAVFVVFPDENQEQITWTLVAGHVLRKTYYLKLVNQRGAINFSCSAFSPDPVFCHLPSYSHPARFKTDKTLVSLNY